MSAGKAKDLHYAVWPTARGPVGAVAGDKGLIRPVLPHYRRGDLKELLACPQAQTLRHVTHRFDRYTGLTGLTGHGSSRYREDH